MCRAATRHLLGVIPVVDVHGYNGAFGTGGVARGGVVVIIDGRECTPLVALVGVEREGE